MNLIDKVLNLIHSLRKFDFTDLEVEGKIVYSFHFSLKDFSEINIPTALDSGLTTTSLDANTMIQFAETVVLDVNLASYGLLEDLLLRSRSTGNLDLRGQPGHSAFANVVVFVRGDSVA